MKDSFLEKNMHCLHPCEVRTRITSVLSACSTRILPNGFHASGESAWHSSLGAAQHRIQNAHGFDKLPPVLCPKRKRGGIGGIFLGEFPWCPTSNGCWFFLRFEKPRRGHCERYYRRGHYERYYNILFFVGGRGIALKHAETKDEGKGVEKQHQPLFFQGKTWAKLSVNKHA